MDEMAYGFIAGAGIAIIVVAVVLYLQWCLICSAVEAGTKKAIEQALSSAVEAGTIRAMEKMLRRYTDLSDYMKKPLHSESAKQGENEPQ